MKRYSKATIASYKGAKKFKWAFNMLAISVFTSLLLGYISQTMLTRLGIIVATLVIIIFIFFAVLFDMIGVAVVSAEIEKFSQWKQQKIKGASMGHQLCLNCEKVCSFCGDVVGDICSTLYGAGGACVVVAITKNYSQPSVVMLISISVSAVIAGLTIFFKALMKEYSLKKSNKIILKLGWFLEKFIFKEKSCKKL
ncbi:MAG: hypothetical protein J6A28_00640 [Clostridia bacterium]|nr:hypothetical protein [Clostridia bacterium]